MFLFEFINLYFYIEYNNIYYYILSQERFCYQLSWKKSFLSYAKINLFLLLRSYG